MKTSLGIGCALLAGILASAQAQAQNRPASAGRETTRRWAVTAVLGGTLGGPAGDVESSMRRARWADASPAGCFLIFCTEGSAHPRSSGGGGGALLGLRRNLGERLSVEAMYGHSPTGETIGYRDSEFLGEYMTVRHAARWAGAVTSFRARPFRIGAGPALYWTRSESLRGGEPEDADRVLKPGFVVDGGLDVPLWWRFSFDLRAQYRFVGSRAVGPFQTSRETFTAEGVRFDHAFLGAGIGVRF